ncbi:MAG TPA: type II secretion system F family protein [Albitalea sp.]|jgi:tight adherence protein C|nr:type II secretion system F family protein [Albitalea sp.]
MNDLRWIPVVATAAFGLSAAGLTWWLATLIDAVPPEDRTYRDAPPWVFRLVWWPVRCLAHYLGPLLPPGYRRRSLRRLRLAGIDYAMSPEQFLAARVVAASIGGLLAEAILSAFHQPAHAWPVSASLVAAALPSVWLRDRVLARRRETLKTLPFFIDIVILCVEAGLNLTGALAQAVAKGPSGPLSHEVARVLRDVRAGKQRVDALRTFADRMNEPSVTNLVSALIQADNLGMNLGPILRAQSEQRRAERFARAEKLAMEAPVKLLLPLIAFIFPCTFVVLGFPIAMKFIHMGL